MRPLLVEYIKEGKQKNNVKQKLRAALHLMGGVSTIKVKN